MSDSTSNSGLFATLRRVGGTVLGIAGNRLELLVLELQEERNRLMAAITLLLLCVLFAGFSLALLTVAAVYLLWNTHPLAALLVVAAIYAAAAAVAGVRVQRLLAESQPFADTLAEFRKDQQCLQAAPTKPSASESSFSSSKAS